MQDLIEGPAAHLNGKCYAARNVCGPKCRVDASKTIVLRLT